MARPRTPIGTYGDPYYEETDGGRQIAVVRFRDFDGRTRKIKAVGRSKAEALRRLEKKIANHEAASAGEEDLTADSLFVELADAWLQSLDDTKRLAPSTRYRYERDLRVPRQAAGRFWVSGKLGVSGSARPRWTSRGRFQAIASCGRTVLYSAR